MDLYLKQFKTKSTSNYVSLSNGKYFIPNERRMEFFKQYVSSIYDNEYMYLVERVQYPCKLYIDIDNKNKISTSQIVQHVLEEIHSENVIICKCTETDGYHIIFNDIVLNSKEDIIQFLPEKIKEYIDLSVYSSGLRMIGSRKPHMDRVYLPYKMIVNQKTKIIRDISLDMLVKCSINVNDQNMKQPVVTCKINKNKSESLNVSGIRTDLFSLIDEHYKDVYVVKIYQKNSCVRFETRVKYCTNLNDEHKNAYVYFVLTENKNSTLISQRCYCTCKTERSNGLCSKYKSKAKELDFRTKCHFKLLIKSFSSEK